MFGNRPKSPLGFFSTPLTKLRSADSNWSEHSPPFRIALPVQMGDIFYCLALFIAILLASLGKHLSHGPFFMSWWAMTFPADGWAGASLNYYLARPSNYTLVIAVVA